MSIIGRFAPSPTGHLHLGSLTTAVASFCHIKSLGGQWLVRIEDVDFERCKPKFTHSILQDLENLNLYSDAEIIYQSKRTDIYEDYLEHLLAPTSYVCTCSRKTLASHTQQSLSHPLLTHTTGLNAPAIYPRWCLHKHLPRSNRDKIRLILPHQLSVFFDGLQGLIWDNPTLSLGDVVVKRQNGMINYLLACAIDDGLQSITHIMRGLDIMPMTIAQLAIMEQCQLPQPTAFYHLPLLHNQNGQKLSKQNLALPINTGSTTQASQLLVQALTLLKQPIPTDMADGTPDEILAFAIRHWDNTPLQAQTSLGII